MAHPGYMAIGDDDPMSGTKAHEIVNTNRAMAYAEAAGALPWLLECGVCPDINAVIPDGVYGTVWGDPAPWFTPRIPDSAGFFGVIGLELDGADDSTRSANVTTALTGGGIIGRAYEGPRTMTMRALAVADAECSLSYGLRWLTEEFLITQEVCGGDPVTFFECCPQADCGEGPPAGPCWVDTYGELIAGPECDPDFWPTTYADIVAGPPYAPGAGDWCQWPTQYTHLWTWIPPWPCNAKPVGPCWVGNYGELAAGPTQCDPDWWPTTYYDLDSGPTYLRVGGTGDWCDWPGVYRELETWLPPWPCCYELNVIPRWKQMADARVTAGPTVLRRPAMSTGALAEIEFEITAADPTATRPSYLWPESFDQRTTWATRNG